MPWADLILRDAGDAIIATSKDGLVAFMNTVAEDMTGIPHKAALGLPLHEVFRLTHPNVTLPAPRAFRKHRVPRYLRRLTLVAKSGKKTLVDGTIAPILGRKANVIGSVLVFRDVAENVAEEQASLDRQKIVAIGGLARSVSLDFSNWLSAISGHASSIADNLIPNTRAHEEALRILDVAEQAGGLTKRLLSVARAANVKGEAKMERLSLEEIIKDAITLVESTFLKRKISFTVKALDATHYVLAESGLLLDCLIHLFLNAAETISNGGAIRLDVSEDTVAGRHFVTLRIRDTGHGIAKDLLEHIHQPLLTTRRGVASTGGLGLAMAQAAVHKWGGLIKIRSRAQGTSMRVLLPRADAPSAKEPRTREPEQAGAETILFVDDDAKLVTAMKSALQGAGYRVLDATSAEDSVAIYTERSEQIQLCIVDVVMPGKDGKHVLGEILRLDPTAPVIMTSGFSRDYVRGYLERGAWAFIQKPYDSAQLLTVVRRVLDQKTARQKAAAG